MLPPQARWIDSPEASYLHWNFTCVAKVTVAGVVSVTGWGYPIEAKAATREQGKRWTERWVAKRGWPMGDRVREARERGVQSVQFGGEFDAIYSINPPRSPHKH